MKTYGGVDVKLHAFLPRQYMEVIGQLQAPDTLSLAKEAPIPNRQEAGSEGM